MRQGGTDLDSAKKLWHSAVELLGHSEQSGDALVILELADRYRISAYDAQYLAVAVNSNVKLITEDKAFRQSAAQYCATMREFLEPLDPPLTVE